MSPLVARARSDRGRTIDPDGRASQGTIRPGRAVARRRSPAPSRRDLRLARATVPREARRDDGTVLPGVDLDTWVLHAQLQRTGDDAVLAALVDEYQPYAASLAHHMARSGDPLEDIQQVALEALVASLRRFEVERALPFPAFARPTISGAIKRHYRDRGWSIRAPRSVHDLAGALRDAEERLTATHGRTPTRAEVAEAVGAPEDAVRRADAAIHDRATRSLDQAGPDGSPARVESLGGPDADVEAAADRMDLRDAVDHLSGRERDLLHLYYVEEMSQREIGGRYGVSQMQVSRWLASCTARLRSRVGAAS
ncbi:sigma-70 family RNA polymerase sigma factor [Iamia majanohamensis]|uniref:Sigma-70 family RNA polymerase sigma factor n=1 Tax=Iamia majanohamensis TaxID=467976 RepID=A0AAE9YBU5_9ACTN|nr:sigma-70 family RNA polymerase sigma factor [Iamia majanohamensis]WCO68248.1 sigma-70 family RNA polymerase sigma factor [Iamia majanohamensis]